MECTFVVTGFAEPKEDEEQQQASCFHETAFGLMWRLNIPAETDHDARRVAVDTILKLGFFVKEVSLVQGETT